MEEIDSLELRKSVADDRVFDNLIILKPLDNYNVNKQIIDT